MAQEEISSLLLRVGVDYASLERFAETMPVVVEVAAAVGKQLDQLQIGNPEVFRAKGQALSRAMVAGFQAEALGLSFGGQDIAGIITQRVFGKLDPSMATRYVQDVQRILDNVRLQLPELNAPLVSQQALNALGQVGSLAGQSRRELEGMASQLDGVLHRLQAVSSVRLPQTLVQRTPEGEFRPTPSALRAAEALGVPLRETVVPQLHRGQPSLAGTSAALGQVLQGERAAQEAALRAQRDVYQQEIRGRIVSALPEAQPVTLYRGEAPNAGTASQPGTGTDLRGRFFAQDLETAREYAGAMGRVVRVMVSATEAENARTRAIQANVLEGLVVDPETARRATLFTAAPNAGLGIAGSPGLPRGPVFDFEQQRIAVQAEQQGQPLALMRANALASGKTAEEAERELAAASRRLAAARAAAAAATGAGGGGRMFAAGPGGLGVVGQDLVPTGVGRGIPLTPGVAGLRAQRERIAAAEWQARQRAEEEVFAAAAGGRGRGAPPPPPPPWMGATPFAGGEPLGRGGGPIYEAKEPLGTRLRRGVREGFLGREDGDPAEFFARSAASAARFSLVYAAAYGALRLFTGAFSQGVQGAIEFEQALADLNIATERTGRSNEALAFSLGNIAAGAGFSAGEGVAAGARAVGLFGATEASAIDQAEIAKVSTEVATQVAFISGQTLEQVQTQIAGITRSFGISDLDQARVADVASFVGRRTGRPGGEILQSLGQIGSLGESAGFDLEQVAAIIARLTSTTGQTPQAVSGFLSQVLSRADDPRLTARLRGVGVQTQGTTLAQQIEQLSALDLPDEQRNQIIQAFGRGRSGQALGIILDQFPEIQALAGGARTGAEGLAERDFQQASNTVGAQVRILGSSLKDLATGLASTGVLDILVALLEGAQLVVDVLDTLVDTFNLIPREVRTTIAVLGELALAFALLSRFGRTAAAVTTATGVAQNASVGARFAGAASFLGDFVGRAGRLPAGQALGAGLTGARGALTGPLLAGGLGTGVLGTGLTGLGAAGVGALAVGAIGVIKTINEAQDAADAIRRATRDAAVANTPEEFGEARARIERAQELVKEREDFKFLSKDVLTLGLGTVFGETFGSVDEDRARLAAQERALKEREERAKEVAATDEASVFGQFGAEEVAQGMGELSERGFTAAQRLQLLNQAFDGLILKAGATSGAIGVVFQGQGERFSRAVATGSIDLANREAAFLRDQARLSDPYTGGLASDVGAFLGNAVAQSAGLTPGLGLLTGGRDFSTTSRELREKAEKFQDAFTAPELQDKLSQSALEELRKRGKDPAVGPVSLNNDDVKAIEEGQLEILRGVFGEDFSGIPEEIRASFLATLPGSIRRTFGDFNGATIDPANVRAQVQAGMADAAEAGADLTLSSGDQVAGAELTLNELRALRGRVSAAAGTATTVDQAQEIARQGQAVDQAILRQEAQRAAARMVRIDALNEYSKSQLAQGDVLGENALDRAAIGQKLALPGLTDDERTRLSAQSNQLARKDEQDRLALNAARVLNLLPVRGVERRARQEIANATARLATLAPDSLEYEQTVASINQLRDQLATYALDLSQATAQLGINPNNAAAGNRAALADARARLADAQRTGDPLAVARAGRAWQLAEFQTRVIDPLQLRQAQRRAAIDPGNEIGNAGADVRDAEENLRTFDYGSREYFEALRRLRDAQSRLGNTLREQGQRLRRLRTDLTDPVEQALADVRDAQEELAAARARGGDTSVEEMNLRQAQNNAEQQAFQQRFNDARVADDLGRISHTAYIEYLQNEHDRLSAISDRTRQQQEQLDQVDQALKAASDQFAGQWNLGEINIPTPFEMRRNIATPELVQEFGGTPRTLAGGSVVDARSIVVNVNGGDVNQVRTVLAEFIGPVAMSRTPTVTPTRI